MNTSSAGLNVHPIDASELDDIRRQGVDRWGDAPDEFVSDGGDQLRCCLRHSRPGEMFWAVSRAPLTIQRPWREVGPVYVNAEPCDGYDPARGLPDFISGRPRVLRSCTSDGAMYYAGSRLTRPGNDVGAVLQTLLEDPAIAEVTFGTAQCFIARVTR